MGYSIAAAALEAKHEVILISTGRAHRAVRRGGGPRHEGREMFEAAAALRAPRCLRMCAAVCDYKPAAYTPQKTKKQEGPFSLALEPTRDILASLTSRPHDCLVVGFAAETEELMASAQRKLREKNCDLIVANDVGRAEVGMDSDDNELVIFFKNGESEKLSRAKKTELARVLLKIILATREKCLTKKT